MYSSDGLRRRRLSHFNYASDFTLYQLTPKGRDLLPVLAAMEHWAEKHVAGVRAFPAVK
jgi:DNA-binding HxlR family transcriptional regulator